MKGDTAANTFPPSFLTPFLLDTQYRNFIQLKATYGSHHSIFLAHSFELNKKRTLLGNWMCA